MASIKRTVDRGATLSLSFEELDFIKSLLGAMNQTISDNVIYCTIDDATPELDYIKVFETINYCPEINHKDYFFAT